MKYKPGQSGNPGGRPKMPKEIREAARAECIKSIETLVALRDDERAPKKIRLQAAIAILDRGVGRPHQTVDFTIQDLTDDELRHELVRRFPQYVNGNGRAPSDERVSQLPIGSQLDH